MLRGRLGFAEAQIYGRLSGLHMQNLSRWEHAIGDTLIDDDLRRSLEFVRDRVLKGGPRMVESAVGDVYHLYTDACFEKGIGGLGGVLFNQHGKMLAFFSEKVNPDQVDKLNPLGKETIIFELEALAAYIGCSVLLQPAAVRPSDRVTESFCFWTTTQCLAESSLARVGLAWMAASYRVSLNGKNRLGLLLGMRECHLQPTSPTTHLVVSFLVRPKLACWHLCARPC